jgi:glycopeptide antibiotics resistance protein
MNLNYDVDFEWFYGLLILIIVYLINRKKIEMSTKIDKFILFTYYIYIISLISVVFFPIPLYLINETQKFTFSFFVNFIPFKTILIVIERNPIQLIGNFLLLLPLGIFYPLMRTNNVKFKRMFFTGFFISLIIETIQLLGSLAIGVPFRVFDIDDLIVNTIGCITGYCLLKISLPHIVKTNLNSQLIKLSKDLELAK